MLEALRSAADALSNWQGSQQQLTSVRQAEHSASKATEAAMARLRAGLVNKLSLLDAQETQLMQQSARLDAEAAQRLSWVALHTALGGSFAARHPAPPAR
ncbi:TolC family protein [Paludibacterium denitrificans]|uniref:TolC family protein n=1 Tax=Paludibacterium denitrificans TaxID=2675226 RepID=UPI001E301EB3|nr:TolC family protein [Paludibacterium denitrificans]